MKKKKITIIISHDYDEKNTISNNKVAERIKRDLLKGSDLKHERIESVVVSDINISIPEPNKIPGSQK